MRRQLGAFWICCLLATAALGQSFAATGSLNTARADAAAVRLANGQVLVLGGFSVIYQTALASAELYDPASGTFTPTGSLSLARSYPQAVRLASGKVFVVSADETSTDIYDPASGAFSPGPPLPQPVNDPHAVLLPDGRVWIVGALDCQNCSASPIDIYDPGAGTLSQIGQLQLARGQETVVGLGDGRVLVFDGWGPSSMATTPTGSFEICDASGTCSLTNMLNGPFLADAGAMLLASGQVLICGGNTHGYSAVPTCELFDPGSLTLSPTTGVMAVPRLAPTLTPLPDGTVLVAGGRDGDGPDAEIYHPQLGRFSNAGNFPTPRARLDSMITATALADGTVLIAGGLNAADPSAVMAEAEIFTPGAPVPDFSLSAAPTQVSVSTGTTATFRITAHGNNGFSGTVALSCSGNGSNPCTFDPASIIPGQSSTLTVGNLDLASNGLVQLQAVGSSGQLSHQLDLRIALQAPLAELNASPLNFGNQNVGSTSPAQTVALSNGGAGTLHISGISASGDFKESDNCPSSIANGGPSCKIQITFSPTAAGARTGTLQIADDAPFSPQTVALSGTGLAAPAPKVALQPASLSFGDQSVGVGSAAQTITVSNTGSADLIVASVAASGDFSEINNCGTVAAGKSCAVAITFQPNGVGSRNGALTLTDNAGGSPQTALLTGTGEAAPVPGISFAPAALTFAAQAVGSASPAQAVTVTNSGGAALQLAIAASAGFGESNTCGASLAAGKSCAVAVTFAPTAVGNASGQLSFTDNASGSPQTVSLSGSGTGGASSGVDLAPTGGGSTSSTVTAGQPAAYPLEITATGGFDGTVSLACTGAPAGATCTPSPASVSAGGTPVPITVTVTTTAGRAAAAVPALPGGSLPTWPWLALLGLAPMLAALMLKSRNQAQRAPRHCRWAVAAALGLELALGLAACGGSPSAAPAAAAGGTPAGSYTLTLAASANGATVGTTQLTLVVQ